MKKGTSAKGGAIEKPPSRSSETRTLGKEKNAGEGFLARCNRFKSLLARPVNGASLAAFRIAVGLVMTLEAFSLLRPSASTSGRVMLETYYTGSDIKFHFPYGLFEWLPVLPNAWLHALVWVLGIGSIFLAVGFCYRGAASLVFLVWGYFYGIESTRTYWMSYYYLELLVTFLLIWMPAAQRYSIDALLFKGRLPIRTVPYWTLVLLRGQLVIAYFYAGLAKINADWLLDAVPVRNFLARSSFLKRCESFFSVSQMHSVERVFNNSELAYFLSWTGALFDLSVGFLLLFRRTRMIGFVLLVLFHMTNHFILFDDIIWFPLLGILTATIFFNPDWPERLWHRVTRAKPTATNESEGFYKLGRFTAGFVTVWLVWQSLMPLRQYLIPGDGRFTWEGISFSWRLKTEIYSSSPCEITIKDKAIAAQDTSGKIKIDWNQWHGDKVIYRKVTPNQIDWARLPEIVVLSEPEIGERIIYNPYWNSKMPRSEAESRERLARVWKELYGRAPTTIQKTIPLSEIVDGYITAMKQKGATVPGSRDEALAMLLKLHGRGGNAQMIPFLRRMHPFATLHDGPVAGSFLLIEDGALLAKSATGLPHLQPAAWKAGVYTLPAQDRYTYAGGEPLIIHIAEIGLEQKRALPQMFIFDSLENLDEGPGISWDYLRDLSVSQAMHISTQPFLLRRYARRAAELWEKEYGRRPEVHASTAVSLNGRPHQALVDPKADLASVSASHFRHNSWIEDLQTRRIPPSLH